MAASTPSGMIFLWMQIGITLYECLQASGRADYCGPHGTMVNAYLPPQTRSDTHDLVSGKLTTHSQLSLVSCCEGDSWRKEFNELADFRSHHGISMCWRPQTELFGRGPLKSIWMRLLNSFMRPYMKEPGRRIVSRMHCILCWIWYTIFWKQFLHMSFNVSWCYGTRCCSYSLIKWV